MVAILYAIQQAALRHNRVFRGRLHPLDNYDDQQNV